MTNNWLKQTAHMNILSYLSITGFIIVAISENPKSFATWGVLVVAVFSLIAESARFIISRSKDKEENKPYGG